jgi:hypothetical protein
MLIDAWPGQRAKGQKRVPGQETPRFIRTFVRARLLGNSVRNGGRGTPHVFRALLRKLVRSMRPVVERHELDTVVKEQEGCDPASGWANTAQQTSEQTSELISLWEAARRSQAGDGAVLPLSQVSKAMDEDDSCAVFCIDRAGSDGQGNSLVSEVVLEELAARFGHNVETALAELRFLTGQEWLVSCSRDFEQHCEMFRSSIVNMAQQDQEKRAERSRFMGRAFFGACFEESSHHYVLLKWSAEGGLSKQAVLRDKLEAAVAALQEAGCKCIPYIRWNARVAQRIMQQENRAAAKAYGCYELPGLPDSEVVGRYEQPESGSEFVIGPEVGGVQYELPDISTPSEQAVGFASSSSEPATGVSCYELPDISTPSEPVVGVGYELPDLGSHPPEQVVSSQYEVALSKPASAPAKVEGSVADAHAVLAVPNTTKSGPWKVPLWTLLSGHSYCFVREVQADPTRADWTGLLRWALALPNSSPFYREEKGKIFATLSEMFIHNGLAFAKQLIDESFRPEFARKIKPDLRFGGIAGGKKYMHHSEGTVLFKFAEDVELGNGHWVYGGSARNDRLAMKSAGHELKSTP